MQGTRYDYHIVYFVLQCFLYITKHLWLNGVMSDVLHFSKIWLHIIFLDPDPIMKYFIYDRQNMLVQNQSTNTLVNIAIAFMVTLLISDMP